VRSAAPADGDIASLFEREAVAADAAVVRVASIREARDMIASLLRELGAKRVVSGNTELLRELDVRGDEFTVEVCQPGESEAERDALRASEVGADVGLTDADYGIAESGTLALLHRPGQGRAISLLPPVHVAVLRTGDLLPDLSALFERLDSDERHPASALTFITGPSRTGDIEFVITKGVHGPGALHVVLLDTD
jgi:L-lactate dehydrogenase complex protein LldG